VLYRFVFWITIGPIASVVYGQTVRGQTVHVPAVDAYTPTPAADMQVIRGKTVLVLHSYYKGYRWTDDEGRGIDSVLLPAVGASNLYIEYMDTKRFYGHDSLEQFPEAYRRKFMSHRFDVIVATDNNAFDFLREYRDQLFPNTPVVFCGVNYFKAEDLQGHRLFTGVSEEADVKDTLDLALRLHPATNRVYIVNELSETGQTVHDEVVRQMPSYAGRVTFTFLEDYSMPDLLATLKALPANSLVFYSFFSRDQTGRFFEYDRSAAAIGQASRVPIYGGWDFNLGYGMVGGKLISGFYQGVAAGKIALRVLGGEAADAIPVVRFTPDRPNRYMFDYVQLRRFGIPLGALPKDSVIQNMPESFYQRHRLGSWAGSALILFLVVANSILVRNVRRRKAAERALWNQQEHLEELVTSRSAQLENLNSRLRLDILKREATERALRESQRLLNKTFASLPDCLLIITVESRTIVDCNPAISKLFGYAREEVVGQSVRLLHVDGAAFERFRELAGQAIREKGYLRIPSFQMKRRNGDVFATQHSVMPLYDEDGVLVSWVSVIRDITQEKRFEEKLGEYRRKLRKLAAELTVVEARERRAIAAELHENLGQVLATAKLKIAPLRTLVPDSGLRARIGEVQGLVEEALQQTRSLTYQLSPPILYQLGLEAALKWLAEKMEKQHGYRVAFTRLGESGEVREESSVFLFSAVRELLVNVAKHARASEVAVRLRWLDDGVEVLVKDNGKGFRKAGLFSLSDWNVGAADSQEGFGLFNDGFGLFNIQERVSDLGGRVSLRSEPLKGTAVKIHLPLDPAVRNMEMEHEHQNSAGR
jgi:PAS domain S-box-containing protein